MDTFFQRGMRKRRTVQLINSARIRRQKFPTDINISSEKCLQNNEKYSDIQGTFECLDHGIIIIHRSFYTRETKLISSQIS